MASEEIAEQVHPAAAAAHPETAKRIVNDFSIQAATVNGSGSQSANNVLLRSIFRMGIPVSGKNLFPSNIAGLPTWFTIRASKRGYIARKKEIDIVIAMNPETAREDVMSLPPGGVAICDEPLHLDKLREDITFYTVPFDKITAGVCPEAKLRKLVRNMVYVGVTARLLGIEMEGLEKALRKNFAKKPKAAELNWNAVRAGYDYAAESLTKRDPFVLEKMHANEGKIVIDGNAALALGAVFAGVTVVTWYPITPSSSVVEKLSGYLRKYRVGPDGKATFAVVQAEDELAAIGGVIGAGWAGARAMTATSGPGISLMAEFAGLGYFAEIPAVVIDVQRVGPSTGLPTRTMQGDLLSAAFLSHGDTKHVVLLPGNVRECFDFAIQAFDLAERLQTPVFVLSDLDLGMNNWMSEPFEYPEKPIDRGKVLTAEQVAEGHGFARYRDVDGDGIPYRTLPGTDHPLAAYFTRGSGHNDQGNYSERPDDYEALMERLARKFDTARNLVPAPIEVQSGKSKIGIIAYGTSDFAVEESRDQLLKEFGVETDYLRIRAYPFPASVQAFIAAHERVYVVEQNRDAQMLSLLKLDLSAEDAGRLRSIRHFNGLPIDARSVTDAFVMQEEI
jgi:2-oxoglutarate ferredoxin oxidoreductase subunit alpha